MRNLEELYKEYDKACLQLWKAFERRTAVFNELRDAVEEDFEHRHKLSKGDELFTKSGKKVRYVKMHNDKLDVIICNDMRQDGEWGTREMHYNIKEF